MIGQMLGHPEEGKGFFPVFLLHFFAAQGMAGEHILLRYGMLAPFTGNKGAMKHQIQGLLPFAGEVQCPGPLQCQIIPRIAIGAYAATMPSNRTPGCISAPQH